MLKNLLISVGIPAVQGVAVLLIVLLIVAYLTLLERKVIAFMQVRLGPRRVGPHGLLQPIADVIKLLIKEDITPKNADKFVFALAPILAVFPAIAAFAVIPFAGQPVEIFGIKIRPYLSDVNVGLLYLLAISSLGVFGIVLGGWASNSKYPMLGGLRSAAQMVSYEVPLGFSIIGVLMISQTASMVGIVEAQKNLGFWFFIPQIVGLFIYFVSGVAETNRTPFDLPEAENELVAGFHTEYSGMKFAFFFLAEYINMIVVGAIVTTLFLGGWLPPTSVFQRWIPFLGTVTPSLENFFPFLGPFGSMTTGIFWFATKTFFIIYLYLWLRATFPRYRYDRLMALGWKWLIPLSIVNVLATGAVIILLKSF
ncbi:MAG: NADH-quinone oxidoreductase subunit NuoH [Acidobacteriota bacterium]